MATCIGESVKTYYEDLNLKLRFDFYSDNDLDKEADFYVLRKTKMSCGIIRMFIFDNYEDYKRLVDPEFQKELAWRIYQGIITYLNL